MRTPKGFTILEFLIVAAIVVVLIAVVFPRLMNSDLEVERPVPAQVAPGTAVPIALRLSVARKLPDVDEKVTFSVTEGGGSVNPTEAQTDSTGRVVATWTLGAAPGTRNALLATAQDGQTTRVEVVTLASPTITTDSATKADTTP